MAFGDQTVVVERSFALTPAEETHKRLREQGCELNLGKASWDSPHGDNEMEMVRLASGCDALAGTSIRSSPITRGRMERSDTPSRPATPST